LDRLEKRLPTPVESHPYDIDRLTVQELERFIEVRGRLDLVGTEGLTDQEVTDVLAIVEVLSAPEPPETQSTKDRTTHGHAVST